VRVQLRVRQIARSGEDGAVALLAALLSSLLLVVAAFTLDFGLAYTSKQQLQAATDAGALAAAQVYKGRTGPCAVLAVDPILKTQAQAAADSWAVQNRADTVGEPITVSCPTEGLTVTYSASGTTPVGLGQLAGVDSEIALARTAAATIGKNTAAIGGLRPWGICSGVATTSGEVVFVPMEDGSTTTEDSGTLCGSGAPPGGWWVMECTDQSNANGTTTEAVLSGCPESTYTPVPGQVTTNPTLLHSFLSIACPRRTANDTCLGSDPGNNFHNSSDAWQTLVGKTFTMPVVCGTPTCSQLQYVAQGNNATYAIHRLATVELCGFRLMPRSPSLYWPSTGPCATSNPRNYTSASVTNGAGLFLVVKGLTGGPTSDWSLEEYTALRLTK